MKVLDITRLLLFFNFLEAKILTQRWSYEEKRRIKGFLLDKTKVRFTVTSSTAWTVLFKVWRWYNSNCKSYSLASTWNRRMGWDSYNQRSEFKQRIFGCNNISWYDLERSSSWVESRKFRRNSSSKSWTRTRVVYKNKFNS